MTRVLLPYHERIQLLSSSLGWAKAREDMRRRPREMQLRKYGDCDRARSASTGSARVRRGRVGCAEIVFPSCAAGGERGGRARAWMDVSRAVGISYGGFFPPTLDAFAARVVAAAGAGTAFLVTGTWLHRNVWN